MLLACWPLMVLGALTPTGGLLILLGAVMTALGAALRRAWRVRRGLLLLALALLAQVPWLLPSIFGGHDATSDPGGVDAFAARAERPGGVWLTLVSGGGVWTRHVVPPSSHGLRTRPDRRRSCSWCWAARRNVAQCPGLWLAAGSGLVVAGLAHLPGGEALLTWAMAHVPGAGLARDGQKWVARGSSWWWPAPASYSPTSSAGSTNVRPTGASSVQWLRHSFRPLFVPDAPGRTWAALAPVRYSRLAPPGRGHSRTRSATRPGSVVTSWMPTGPFRGATMSPPPTRSAVGRPARGGLDALATSDADLEGGPTGRRGRWRSAGAPGRGARGRVGWVVTCPAARAVTPRWTWLRCDPRPGTGTHVRRVSSISARRKRLTHAGYRTDRPSRLVQWMRSGVSLRCWRSVAWAVTRCKRRDSRHPVPPRVRISRSPC